MNFTEKDGFDSDSIALHDRIEAIASSENVSYSEACDRLLARITPTGKQPSDFDEASTKLAEKIQKFATQNQLSFSEAYDQICQEAASFTELDPDAAFEQQLSLI